MPRRIDDIVKTFLGWSDKDLEYHTVVRRLWASADLIGHSIPDLPNDLALEASDVLERLSGILEDFLERTS